MNATEIKIERQAASAQVARMGIFSWPTWTKEVSEFPWTYENNETCYFLEGDVVVTPDDGEPVRVGKGDLVVFPKGMSCTWQVLVPVKKHYRFG